MPYQSTWINPYLPQGNVLPTGALGQFPYPQGVQAQQPVTPQQYQQPVNGIVKVNGRDSALQVQLPPNSTSVPLIDSSFDGKRGTFYVVSTDGTGTKSVEAYDFVPHVDQQPVQIDGANFVSRQEYDQFVAKVSAALGALNGTYGPVQAQQSGPAASGIRGADGTASVDAVGRPDPARSGGGAVGGNMPDA